MDALIRLASVHLVQPHPAKEGAALLSLGKRPRIRKRSERTTDDSISRRRVVRSLHPSLTERCLS